MCLYSSRDAEGDIKSKMQEVTKGSRQMNSEELHELWEPNTLCSQTKEGEMGRKSVTHWTEGNAQWNFVGKTKGKRPLEKSRKRWNDNIKMCQ